MKAQLIFLIMILSAVIAGAGCSTTVEAGYENCCPGPPRAPSYISGYSGNFEVYVSWSASISDDVDYYCVYTSMHPSGPYTLLDTTYDTWYYDTRAVNGSTYYYSITAVDLFGNESDFSVEVLEATPRPEGYELALDDAEYYPDTCGFDFSRFAITAWDNPLTDVYYVWWQGVPYLSAGSADVYIMDAGYTESLHDITVAPENGWSPYSEVEIMPGHTYLIWMYDNHFAKMRVVEVGYGEAGYIIVDWVYQSQEGNPYF